LGEVLRDDGRADPCDISWEDLRGVKLTVATSEESEVWNESLTKILIKSVRESYP